MSIQRLYRLLIAFIIPSFSYITYRVYSFSQGLRELQVDVLAGTAAAPWQYRFLPHVIASYVERLGIPFYQTFALMDVVALGLALLIFGRFWLQHLPPNKLARTLFLFILIAIIEYWLIWSIYWHQVPYTLPSLLYVAVTLFIVTTMIQRQQFIWPTLALFVCTTLQITIRADIAFATTAGFAIYFLFNASHYRWTPGLIAGAVAAFAVTGQAYLSFVLFPDAVYNIRIVQLVQNLSPVRVLPFLLYMVVYGLVVRWWWIRPKPQTFDPFVPILYASVIHLLMWVTAGIIDETRIFLPLSLPLAHYAASFILNQLDLTAESAKSAEGS